MQAKLEQSYGNWETGDFGDMTGAGNSLSTKIFGTFQNFLIFGGLGIAVIFLLSLISDIMKKRIANKMNKNIWEKSFVKLSEYVVGFLKSIMLSIKHILEAIYSLVCFNNIAASILQIIMHFFKILLCLILFLGCLFCLSIIYLPLLIMSIYRYFLMKSQKALAKEEFKENSLKPQIFGDSLFTSALKTFKNRWSVSGLNLDIFSHFWMRAPVTKETNQKVIQRFKQENPSYRDKVVQRKELANHKDNPFVDHPINFLIFEGSYESLKQMAKNKGEQMIPENIKGLHELCKEAGFDMEMVDFQFMKQCIDYLKDSANIFHNLVSLNEKQGWYYRLRLFLTMLSLNGYAQEKQISYSDGYKQIILTAEKNNEFGTYDRISKQHVFSSANIARREKYINDSKGGLKKLYECLMHEKYDRDMLIYPLKVLNAQLNEFAPKADNSVDFHQINPFSPRTPETSIDILVVKHEYDNLPVNWNRYFKLFVDQ